MSLGTTTLLPASVVIPYYRTELSPAERVSLDRCMQVLGKHPIVLVAPESLDLTTITDVYPRLNVETFPAGYFTSVKAYNRLLLSPEFYARFARYEYMLIHQLDAFVFSDQLLDWCRRGYDYVGAPWLPDDRIPTSWRLLTAAVRRRWFRFTRRQYRNRSGDHHAQQHYASGNGGFSLRRVHTMRTVLEKLNDRAEPYRQGTREPWAEDVFFCVEANRYRQNVRVPGFRESLWFSWERQPATLRHFTNGALPFGCHAWDQFHRDDWRPIFATLGYALDEICGKERTARQ